MLQIMPLICQKFWALQNLMRSEYRWAASELGVQCLPCCWPSRPLVCCEWEEGDFIFFWFFAPPPSFISSNVMKLKGQHVGPFSWFLLADVVRRSACPMGWLVWFFAQCRAFHVSSKNRLLFNSSLLWFRWSFLCLLCFSPRTKKKTLISTLSLTFIQIPLCSGVLAFVFSDIIRRLCFPCTVYTSTSQPLHLGVSLGELDRWRWEWFPLRPTS